MLKNLRSILKFRLFVLTSCACFFINFALATELARSQSLDTRITLDINAKPLKQTIDQISALGHVSIIYSDATGVINKPVSIHVKNLPLKDVLSQLLKPFSLTYEIIADQIVIKSDNSNSRLPSQGQTEINAFPVKGKVTNKNGEPLAGATIKSTKGIVLATTDKNGEFEIQNIADSTTLQVSYIGYLTKEINVGGSKFLIIQMQTENSQLNEVSVVSTGYQTIPKERATGSFSQPISEMYNDRVSTDVLSKLNGITSGLVFNANTTATQNGQLDINIRGRSTIFANDQPLVIVDNFPYSGDVNNINPNDVESVTVLKDAAAASIWGVRAGNGVIVITTKKGKLNQPLKIAFNANLTVFNKPNLNYNPNQLDASSYISLEQFLFSKGYYDSSLADQTNYPVISPVVQLLAANRAGTLSENDLNSQLNVLRGFNVNNQLSKYFYQNAANQQYALTLSGGSNKAAYFLSSGYDEDLASVKDNANHRITLNSQNTFYPIKNLEINAGINVVQTTAKIDNTLNQLTGNIFPYTQVANAQGTPLSIPYLYSQEFTQSAESNGYLDWSFYPLKELGETDNVTKTMDIRLSTGLKYTFIKGLSLEAKYQYENTNNQNNDYQSQQTFYTRNLINEFSNIDPTTGKVTGYNVPLGGILNLSNANTLSNNFRAQLNYNFDWKDNSFTALAGYELSQTSVNSNQSILYGYNNNLTTFTNIDAVDYFPINPSGNYLSIPSGLGISSTLARLRSSFVNVAYTYKDKYTLSGSARIDGSNYFGVATNQKTVPLWSAGLKWDINKESFYKLEWLPILAIRGSYGYNGNLDQAITGITTFQYYSNAQYTGLNYAQISNIGNPDLRWEKTGITNLAIDFGTKNEIITGSLEYYLKKETDLLGFKTFPENVGITSLEGNYSDMKGSGFDLSITSHNIRGTNFKWSTTFLFSHAVDQVTHYDVTPYSYQLVGDGTGVPNVGKPVFGVYGYKWGGLDHSTGNPIGFVNGVASQDYSTITTATPVNSLVYVGPARPTYFGGLNNQFSYKGFTLLIQINYKLGYYFTAPTINYSSIGSDGNAFLAVNRDFNRRWQNPGDEEKTNVPSLIYPFNYARDKFYQFSTVNIQNASNIRIQDISFSYDFNKTRYPNLPFARLQLFAYANNVGMIWKANHLGLDPDAIPGQGDYTTMPVPRSIAIGLKGSF